MASLSAIVRPQSIRRNKNNDDDDDDCGDGDDKDDDDNDDNDALGTHRHIRS